MKLNHLSDDALLIQTEGLVKKERELLTSVLHHLKEIDRRRLFSNLKFASIYEYAVKKLGYSEDQAYRRIAAMRLLKEIPELEAKINEGSLNLTHMGMAQSYFKREKKVHNRPMTKSDKVEVLKNLENKSTRDSERVILSLSGESLPLQKEKIRSISEDQVEIKFIANRDLTEKIQKLKGLLAHTHPDISLDELFDKLCDIGIEKLETKVKKTAAPRDVVRRNFPARSQSQSLLNPLEALCERPSQAAINREVRRRADNKCQNCKSHYALEIDHIKPKSLGGDSSLENLRLLCRSCNQRAAIEKLGFHKMQRYLEKQ